MQMEVSLGSIAVSVVLLIIASSWAWRVLNWVWLKPKKLENCLRQQGFAGNSYRLLIGDLKENIKVVKEATSKPMNLSDDVAPRVLPYLHQTINKHGYSSSPGSVAGFATAFLRVLLRTGTRPLRNSWERKQR